jgi:hypothetical protein
VTWLKMCLKDVENLHSLNALIGSDAQANNHMASSNAYELLHYASRLQGHVDSANLMRDRISSTLSLVSKEYIFVCTFLTCHISGLEYSKITNDWHQASTLAC